MADPEDSRERKLSPQLRWYYNNREKAIARATQWTKDNQERAIVTRRARYAAKRNKIIADMQEWRANNPEKAAYTTHKHQAKRRNIPFLFTFEEWCTIWRESGKFAERGHCKGQYVMARHGDVGPYAADNVSIITCSENCSDGTLRRKRNPRRAIHD